MERQLIERSPKFKVGTRVKYYNKDDSTFLKDKVFTVSEIKWKNSYNGWGYKVKEDSSWLFCERSLVTVYDGECNGCVSGCKGEKKCDFYESVSKSEKGEGR